MAKKVDYSVEERLRALYDLQLIHSRIDKLRSVRGELPLEVQDLEDEVSGAEPRNGCRTGYVSALKRPPGLGLRSSVTTLGLSVHLSTGQVVRLQV